MEYSIINNSNNIIDKIREDKNMNLETLRKIRSILKVICIILIPINIVCVVLGIMTKDYFSAMLNLIAVVVLYWSVNYN